MTEDGVVIELVVPTSAAMEELGGRIAPLLAAGDVIRLDGPLGAGKTTFTRGLGRALGARGAVTSPTFVLAREHPTQAGPPLVHVDAYRIASALELDDLDLDWAGSITVVEWAAGKVGDVVESWIEVAIDRPAGEEADGEDDQPRIVRIAGVGPRWAGLDAVLG